MAYNSVSDDPTNDIRVGGGALVGHGGDVAGGVVGGVLDVLDAAVRQVDRVGAVPDPGAVVGLALLEGGAGVVVGHGVVVGVGGDLRQVVVADGVGHCHGAVGDGNRVGHSHWVGYSMAHNTVASNETTVTDKTTVANKAAG